MISQVEFAQRPALSKKVEEVDGRLINERSERTVAVLPPRLTTSSAEQVSDPPREFLRKGGGHQRFVKEWQYRTLQLIFPASVCHRTPICKVQNLSVCN